MLYPSQEGFHFKAEYESQSTIWFLWPYRPDVWRENARPAQKVLLDLINKISSFVKVNVGIAKERMGKDKSLFNSNINIFEIEYNDSWIKDMGPAFVYNDKTKEVKVVSWKFNAWGGICYDDWSKDEKVAESICKYINIDYYQAPFVFEGGSFTMDDSGTMIVNENCALDKKRNKNITKEELETYFINYLGAKKVIWINEGVYNDETGGHVDNMCVFVGRNRLVLNWTDDKFDPQYEASKNTFEKLIKETGVNGKNLEIIKVHQPDPIFITKSEADGIQKKSGTLERNADRRLPASYINFIVGNKYLALPTFNDKFDQNAIDIFSKLFPEKKIIDIYSKEILLGGGNLHCIALSQP